MWPSHIACARYDFRTAAWDSLDMRTIIGWLSATIAGGLGWWLGALVGVGAAVIVSCVAGAVGLYYGYRWFDQNLA